MDMRNLIERYKLNQIETKKCTSYIEIIYLLFITAYIWYIPQTLYLCYTCYIYIYIYIIDQTIIPSIIRHKCQ